MKILLAHRYFWPDTPPYATMLKEIAGSLADAGHEVTVYSSQPSYKEAVHIQARPRQEMLGAVKVVRCRLLPETKRNWLARSLNSIAFLVQFFCYSVFRLRPDLVMISTMPPVLAGYMGLLAARAGSARFVYHCQDIHPEAAGLANIRLVGRGLGYSILRWLDRRTVAGADRVIVLSRDMADTLRERSGASGHLEVINNFAITSQPPCPPSDRRLCKEPGTFRILFAGNIGTFQGLETVVEAALLLSTDDRIEFVFVGDGAARDTLRAKAGDQLDKSIKFAAHQPIEVARYLMSEADLGLVTLSRGIYRVAYPSKTMTYLLEGCPILAMVESESELARFLEAEQVGIAVVPGDAAGMAKEIRALAGDPVRSSQLRTRALATGTRLYSPDVVLRSWTDLVAGFSQS
jgi:glycosyltransferase involved in cell wall biosynthesis